MRCINMAEYKCKICGYTYDEDKGEHRRNLAPGTVWEDVPEDFKRPLYGAPKKMFEKV